VDQVEELLMDANIVGSEVIILNAVDTF